MGVYTITSMRAALPNAYAPPNSWGSTKRSPSPVLPSIRDDDDETGLASNQDVEASPSPEGPCTASGEDSWAVINQGAGSTDKASGGRPSSYVMPAVASPTGLFTVPLQRGPLVSSLSFGSAYAAPINDTTTSPASPEARWDQVSSSSSTGFLPDLAVASDSRQHHPTDNAAPHQLQQPLQQQLVHQHQINRLPQPPLPQHQQHPYQLQPLPPQDQQHALHLLAAGVQGHALKPPPRKPTGMRMVNLITAVVAAAGTEGEASSAAGAGAGWAAREAADVLAPAPPTPALTAPTAPTATHDRLSGTTNNTEQQMEQSQQSRQQQQLQRERTRSLGRSRSEGPASGGPLLPTKIHAALRSPGSETLSGSGTAISRHGYFDLGALTQPLSAPHSQQSQGSGGGGSGGPSSVVRPKAASQGMLRAQPTVSQEASQRPRPPPLSLPPQQQHQAWGVLPAGGAAAAGTTPRGSTSPGRSRGKGAVTTIPPPPPIGAFGPVPPSPSSSSSAGASGVTPLGVVGGLGVPSGLFVRSSSPTGRLLRSPGPAAVRGGALSQSSVPQPLPSPRAAPTPDSTNSEPLPRLTEDGLDSVTESPQSPGSPPLLLIAESLPSPLPEQPPQPPLPPQPSLPLPLSLSLQAAPVPQPQLLSTRSNATGPPSPPAHGALANTGQARPLTPSVRRSCPLPELLFQASGHPHDAATRHGTDGAPSAVWPRVGGATASTANGEAPAAASARPSVAGALTSAAQVANTPHTAGAAAARAAGAKAGRAAAGAAAGAGVVTPGAGGRGHPGVFVDGAAGLQGLDMPSAPPEVLARAPKWLKPSAFQVTEQLRSGRLQELAEKLAAVTCPTFLDLGGLEFSGNFSMPSATADGPMYGIGGATSAAAAAAAGSGNVWLAAGSSSMTPRHRTLRLSLSGIGVVSQRGRYFRNSENNVGAGGGHGQQALVVPAGQHITLYNATLLLTAEQYILVGPGASLTLKGVEVLGCSKEAARASAAVRRRALSLAAAAAAAGGGGPAPSSSAAATAAAGASTQQTPAPAVPSSAGPATTAAAGTPAVAGAAAPATATAVAAAAAALNGSRLLRRSSSPGRTDNAGTVPSGRRASATGGAADGVLGLPPVRRRISNAASGLPLMFSMLPQGQGVSGLPTQELVDPNEYVDDHGLIEVVGGYARISNCRLWPGRCQMALCVSDGGNCSIAYCTAGPCCAAGAKSALASENTTYEGGSAGCVSALYGAKVGLTCCQLRYGEGAIVEGGCDLGLEARGSGTVAVLADCEVVHCGVSASGGARAYLNATHVSDARSHGVLACDSGTTMYVRECRVDDSGGSAAVAAEGGALRLADTTLAGSSGPGLLLLPYNPPEREAGGGGGATAAAPHRQGHGAGAGGAAPPPGAPSSPKQHPQPRSSATLTRCDVSANAGHGVYLSPGCIASLKDSVVYNNLGCGVAVEGTGTALSALGTRLIRNEGHGVRVVDGAGASLSRCCFMSNGRDGLSVEGVSSRSKLSRCESRENRESGLCITGGAAVELSHTRLAANQHDGLAVGGTGSLALAHDCVFNGNVAKGAVVCMGGSAELTDCAVHCNGSKSVQVSDEDSQCVLNSCSLDRQPAAVSGGMLVQQE